MCTPIVSPDWFFHF
ncbi:hypothetical protein V1478_000480 [Vespula squamosa]|uniref:Uncharacterized protein n=1 Tax=Vespula squamosa TaxID=30214 RepID=A0ABD2C6G7_VESSQ